MQFGENSNYKTRVLTDFTLDSFPALVTFTVVAPYGVHTGPTIHTHVHVAFIDILKKSKVNFMFLHQTYIYCNSTGIMYM